MHLFLYQAARHAKSRYGNARHRYSQSSIRSDFDLELLKRGIKGRFEIIGHGDHPWHSVMKRMGIEDEFYGHVIQIEDSKNAVWFKLNYDNIGKHQTKYIGGWRDLDATEVEATIAEYQIKEQECRKLYEHLSTIKTQYYYLNSFINPRTPHHDLVCNAALEAVKYKSILDNAHHAMDAEIIRASAEKLALQEKVREYMKAHKG